MKRRPERRYDPALLLEKVARLAFDGHSITTMARELELSRNAVRKVQAMPGYQPRLQEIARERFQAIDGLRRATELAGWRGLFTMLRKARTWQEREAALAYWYKEFGSAQRVAITSTNTHHLDQPLLSQPTLSAEQQRQLAAIPPGETTRTEAEHAVLFETMKRERALRDRLVASRFSPGNGNNGKDHD
jgi:hypothetical protein